MKLCEQFKKTAKRNASKFDIDSAFISCLTHIQLLIIFPYYSVKHGIQYTTCAVCCEKGENTNNCKHLCCEKMI